MVDESPSVRARVVGLRTCAGPLRDVAVEFGPGVTALYGRNGAGKSWILRLSCRIRGWFRSALTAARRFLSRFLSVQATETFEAGKRRAGCKTMANSAGCREDGCRGHRSRPVSYTHLR